MRARERGCYDGFVWEIPRVVAGEVPMVAEWVENGRLGETELESLLHGGVHFEAGGVVRAQ